MLEELRSQTQGQENHESSSDTGFCSCSWIWNTDEATYGDASQTFGKVAGKAFA